MKILDEAKEFVEKTVPKQATDGQKFDMKTAFISGALVIMNHIIADVPKMSEDAGAKSLKGIAFDIIDYLNSLSEMTGVVACMDSTGRIVGAPKEITEKLKQLTGIKIEDVINSIDDIPTPTGRDN